MEGSFNNNNISDITKKNLKSNSGRNKTPENKMRKIKINYKFNESSGLTSEKQRLPFNLIEEENVDKSINSSILKFKDNSNDKNEYIDAGPFEYKLDKNYKIAIPETYKINNKTLKPCQKNALPKEKSYLISQTNYDKLLNSLKDRDNEIKKIINDKENLNNEMTNLKKKNSKLVNENEILTKNKKDLENKNSEISSEKEKVNTEFKKLRFIYDKLIKLIKYIFELFPGEMKIKKKINELELEGLFSLGFNEENKNLSNLLSSNEKEIIKELEQKQKTIENSERRIHELENSLNSNTLKLLTKNSSNDTKRIRELNLLNEQLQKENAYLKGICQNIKNENGDSSNIAQFDIYMKENSNLQRKNESLDLKNKQLEFDIHNIKIELSEKNNEILILKNEIDEKKQNVILKENAINELINQKNELERNLNFLKKENKEMNNIITKNEQKDSLKKYMNDYENNMNLQYNNNYKYNNDNNINNDYNTNNINNHDNEIKNLSTFHNQENNYKKNLLMNDLLMILVNQSKIIDKNYREKIN